MYSYGSPHTAAQNQDDQHERTFSSYVRKQVVVLKTCLGRWTIGRSGERGSGISVLPARYDDDDRGGVHSVKELTKIPLIVTFNFRQNQPVLYLLGFQVHHHRHHHHHHVVLLAWISLTHTRHFPLSFIASGRSSGLLPVSSNSSFMYVRAGRPAFPRPYMWVHTSLMSSSLLLQQCFACVVGLTWIVFVMGGRWPYSWCLVGYCLQNLFNIACNILA